LDELNHTTWHATSVDQGKMEHMPKPNGKTVEYARKAADLKLLNEAFDQVISKIK